MLCSLLWFVFGRWYGGFWQREKGGCWEVFVVRPEMWVSTSWEINNEKSMKLDQAGVERWVGRGDGGGGGLRATLLPDHWPTTGQPLSGRASVQVS